MFKNQLQVRSQKLHVALPTYTSIQTGPQHAPLFEATVSFNGAEFHSPDNVYYPTAKKAEMAAAEAALQMLGKSHAHPEASPLVKDEQNVCKNLLQELTQKSKVALPKYTTTQSGPPHQRLFTCTVEVGSMSFQGQYALTVKNAGKNAAMFAWSVIKEHANDHVDVDGNTVQPLKASNP